MITESRVYRYPPLRSLMIKKLKRTILQNGNDLQKMIILYISNVIGIVYLTIRINNAYASPISASTSFCTGKCYNIKVAILL